MADYIASDLDADEKNSWGTDPLIFAALDKEFNFSLDAAANNENHLVRFFFTKEDDSLIRDWSEELEQLNANLFGRYTNKNVFVNPPYGRGMIQQFMEKAVIEKIKGVTTVMLVPATLDAQWLPIQDISEIRIVTGGRLSFMHPVTGKKIAGNTKGSMFVIFRPSIMPIITRYVNRDELIAEGKQELDKKIALGRAA